MILVDSSVWIDYFRGVATTQTDRLDALLGQDVLATGDVILTEVLQGFTDERSYRQAIRLFDAVVTIDIGGREVALQAAQNFRILRSKGVTVRKTIDTLIATRCIRDGHPLLFSDRDFDPFVEHLGLMSATVNTKS
jgi:predicted nucleic acid-binding protein